MRPSLLQEESRASMRTGLGTQPGRVQRTMKSTEFKVLYLFIGPKKTAGGFEDYCRELGVSCECIDIGYGPNHDLLCQDFGNELLERLDDYDAYLLSPPCSSFSMARTGKDAGPGPLRGLEGRDRHGLRHLSVEDKKKVKEGTLLSGRAHTVAHRATARRKPWILEQPHWRKDGTSMFMLDESPSWQSKMGSSFTRLINVNMEQISRRRLT